MRRAARVDGNQVEIIEALRGVGAAVQPLHTVGQGCPDLLVSFRQRMFLYEVKDGRKPPSARKLTTHEKAWIANWKAPVYIVNSAAEALEILTLNTNRLPMDRGSLPF